MDSVRELIDLAFDARENPEQGVTTRTATGGRKEGNCTLTEGACS